MRHFFECFQINGDIAFSGGCLEARGARIWIFVGFVLGFAAIIAAVWTMIADFSSGGKKSIIFFLVFNFFYLCMDNIFLLFSFHSHPFRF